MNTSTSGPHTAPRPQSTTRGNMASNTLTSSLPWRSKLRGSRATCCLLVGVAAATAPLTAEAWLAPRILAATRSCQQVVTSTSGCLNSSCRSKNRHNHCQNQQRGGGGGRGTSEGIQLSGHRMGGSGRIGGAIRRHAVDQASTSSTIGVRVPVERERERNPCKDASCRLDKVAPAVAHFQQQQRFLSSVFGWVGICGWAILMSNTAQSFVRKETNPCCFCCFEVVSRCMHRRRLSLSTNVEYVDRPSKHLRPQFLAFYNSFWNVHIYSVIYSISLDCTLLR